MQILRARGIDRLCQFRPQRIAVEMTGQFIARGKIFETLDFALFFGPRPEHTTQAFGFARVSGNAHTAHEKPHRPQCGRHFKFEFERTVARSAHFDQFGQPLPAFGAHPAFEGVALLQPFGIGMQIEDFARTIPDDRIARHQPIECGHARALQRQLQPIRIVSLCQRAKIVFLPFGARVCEHLTTIPGRFCGLSDDHCVGRLKNS